jgi:hypothetical protein
MALSFEWLIDPIVPTTFFTEFYERKPLLIERQQRSKLDRCWALTRSISTSPQRPLVFLTFFWSTRHAKSSRGLLVSKSAPRRRQLGHTTAVHEKGRSLMWSLSQIRPMLEAQQLEQMNARLEELVQLAESRYGAVGSSSREHHRLPNWPKDGSKDGSEATIPTLSL